MLFALVLKHIVVFSDGRITLVKLKNLKVTSFVPGKSSMFAWGGSLTHCFSVQKKVHCFCYQQLEKSDTNSFNICAAANQRLYIYNFTNSKSTRVRNAKCISLHLVVGIRIARTSNPNVMVWELDSFSLLQRIFQTRFWNRRSKRTISIWERDISNFEISTNTRNSYD